MICNNEVCSVCGCGYYIKYPILFRPHAQVKPYIPACHSCHAAIFDTNFRLAFNFKVGTEITNASEHKTLKFIVIDDAESEYSEEQKEKTSKWYKEVFNQELIGGSDERLPRNSEP